MADDKLNRRLSGTGKCLFKGSGPATLTITDFHSWKKFFVCEGRQLTMEEIDNIEGAANYQNFSVAGRIVVEWPLVTLEFNMDKFLGREKSRRPMILSVCQDFAAIMHPFAVDKEWFKGFDSKDRKRFEGYEWVFDQDKEDDFDYKGHIRKGREIFVTFSFSPDRSYHKLEI